MQVLIFRHAERMHAHSDDPPLSQRGLMQANALPNLIEQNQFPAPSKIICSPKVRAIQTMEPLSEKLKIPLQIQTDLNERQSSEHADVFSKRIKRFIDYIEKQSGIIFLVSHLDWIEEALIHIPSDTNLNTAKYQTWPPGQSIEFEIVDSLWTQAKMRSLL